MFLTSFIVFFKVVLQLKLKLINFQVGCIYSGILDADIEKLKTLVRMTSRRGVQVLPLILGHFLLVRLI